MAQKNLEGWISPLKTDFIKFKTEKFKEQNLHQEYQIVVLTNAALKESGVSPEKNKDARKFAQSWVMKQAARQDSKLVNFNKKNIKNQFVVVQNFQQVDSLFRNLRQKGYIKPGANIVHRGHVKAGVAIQAEQTIAKLDAAIQGGSGSAAANKLLKVLKAQARALTPTLSVASMTNITRKTAELGVSLVLIMPELGIHNISKTEEKVIKNQFAKLMDEFVKKHGDELVDISGSKTYMQAVGHILDEVIQGKKKVSTFKSRHKTTSKGKTQKVKKPKVAVIPRLRDTKGRFTSVASIQKILQAQIVEKVKENMGEGGSLVNRTGRFAESVTINSVTQSRQGTLTAFYNYMKYPYQTFERGFKQGSTRRDPRLLIHKSIREIAQTLVHNKLNIKTRRV
jgi:hypothetical protein